MNNMAKILGATNHSKDEREKDDFYATDTHALQIFLDTLDKDGVYLNHNIWEPACGDGAISKELLRRSYRVRSSDMLYRGFGNMTLNFCAYTGEFEGDIMTNPPYKHAVEFVKKALTTVEEGKQVIMLLRLQFLEGVGRGSLFDKHPPKYVYVYRRRVTCHKNNVPDNKGSAVCYAWFIWKKGYQGDTILRWITNQRQLSLF